jgi:hypothetical protein
MFFRVTEPFTLGWELTLQFTANLTAGLHQCALACRDLLTCDVFGMHKNSTTGNCALMTFASNTQGTARSVDQGLTSYNLYYK